MSDAALSLGVVCIAQITGSNVVKAIGDPPCVEVGGVDILLGGTSAP